MEILKDYTCITGVSSGIGVETAKQFVKLGSNLILVARHQERLEELRETILSHFPELDVIIKVVDLSKSHNVFKLYKGLKSYRIRTWINNAGFGSYDSVEHQNLKKVLEMLHLNIETLTILSSLYVRDYKDCEGAQLTNIPSRGGYMMVPDVITYCASKFYISSSTEDLALELRENHNLLRTRVLAPAATKAGFGQIATDSDKYDHDEAFSKYHTSEEMAQFLTKLCQDDQTVGLVDVKTFEFHLNEPPFNH